MSTSDCPLGACEPSLALFFQAAHTVRCGDLPRVQTQVKEEPRSEEECVRDLLMKLSPSFLFSSYILTNCQSLIGSKSKYIFAFHNHMRSVDYYTCATLVASVRTTPWNRGAGALKPGKDTEADGESSATVELAEGGSSPQREEHNGDVVELLHNAAHYLEKQQQLDQQQQKLELPNDNNQGSDSDAGSSSSGVQTPPGSPPRAGMPAPVESDDKEMAGTKIGIPKFTGQDTDVSYKARDWFTGLQTYFTEKIIGNGDWERRCGLIRWSLVLDSIPDGQDSTSASSWFKGIMEDDGPGGRVFMSFNDFKEKFEKRWITGTPLEEAANIFRRLTQNQRETIREYTERIMREDGRLMRLGMSMMQVDDANRTGWRQAFEWLNIIVLMGGLWDEFHNQSPSAFSHVPRIPQRSHLSR